MMPRHITPILCVLTLVGCIPQPPTQPTLKQPVATSPQPPAKPKPAVAKQAPKLPISHVQTQLHDALDYAITTDQHLTKYGVVFRPGYNGARHTHGGKSASLYRASFSLSNPTKNSLTVKLQGLAFARKHCRSKAWPKAKTLKTSDIQLNTSNIQKSKHIKLPANTSTHIQWNHEALSVYQSCNHFKYQLTLQVAQKTNTLEIPVRVVRMEPYRPRR